MRSRFLLRGFICCLLAVVVPGTSWSAPTPTPKPKVAKSVSKKQPPKKNTKATPKKKASTPSKKGTPKPAAKTTTPAPTPTAAPAKAPDLDALSKLQGTNSKEPTFIKSDTLTLNADDRVFIYAGNVEVKQGLMTLTCAEIEGRYNDKNQIDTIDARRDVVIVKEDLRGTAQKAFFDAKTNTVTLTQNPEVQQNGSILSADSIKIFLNENRSVAEGTVRVKLVEKTGGGEPVTLR